MSLKQKIKSLVPERVFQIYEDNTISKYANKYKDELENFLRSKECTLDDAESFLRFIEKEGVHVFPYDFIKKYDYKKVEVFMDSSNGLNYVVYNGNRLYYKRGFEKRQIQRRFNMSLIEQDLNSAHCYTDQNFKVESNDTLVDIGVAEGNFSFMNVDKASKVYLFEADAGWLEALNCTFSPWKEKVTIVNKFVSNKDSDTTVSLNAYFRDLPVNFIKIDVDGEEANLLKGADNLMNKDKLKVAICTYHNQDDAHDFDELLKKKSFVTRFSNGYMLFYFDPNFKPPYFRKGVIRAAK